MNDVSTPVSRIDELVESFALLGPWEERYRYLVELGRKLQPLPEADKTDANKVRGCMSQVWLTSRLEPGPPARLRLKGDSDAHIVRGLIALLFEICDGRTPRQIAATDIGGFFERLGLNQHITVNRRNGFYSMVERIKTMAAQQAQAA